MDTSEILTLLRHRPFRPFTMRMNDGREFAISHPDWVNVTVGNVTVVSDKDQSTTFLEPVLIASIHFQAAPEPTSQGVTQEST